MASVINHGERRKNFLKDSILSFASLLTAVRQMTMLICLAIPQFSAPYRGKTREFFAIRLGLTFVDS
jgi:hypothetical protein